MIKGVGFTITTPASCHLHLRHIPRSGKAKKQKKKRKEKQPRKGIAFWRPIMLGSPA
jgi:hypothetical protein